MTGYGLHIALGKDEDQSVNPALYEFLTQQKWATAYEKSPSKQKTFVLHGSGQPPSLTLPYQKEMTPQMTGPKLSSPTDIYKKP